MSKLIEHGLRVQMGLDEVNMNLTLEENGIDGVSADDSGLSAAYSPALFLYWCDDLTIA